MRIVILPRPRVGRLGAGACCCGLLLRPAAGSSRAESGPMRMRGFTGVLLQARPWARQGCCMPEIRKIQISVRIQISAAAGFSAGWLRISATSQRLRNRADDKGCTLAPECINARMLQARQAKRFFFLMFREL
jgi:hypothetical protein